MIRPGKAVGATLSLGLVLGLMACGGSKPHDDASPPTGRPSDQQVCAIVDVPRERTLGDHTFAELVDLPPESSDLSGTAAAIFLIRSRYRGNLGPYQPVIDHLAALGRMDADERGDRPEADAAVRRSARRLDRALADGLCK